MKYAYTYHFRPILYILEIGCADLGADLRKLLPKSAQRSCARLGAWTFSTSAVLKPRPQIGPEPGPKSQRRRTIPATFMVRTFGAAGRRKSDIERVSSRRPRRASLLKNMFSRFPSRFPDIYKPRSAGNRSASPRARLAKKCCLLAVRAVRAPRSTKWA